MAKNIVMKKDNVIINADERLAAELRLRGYVEEGEATTEEIAKQPNPYTVEEVEAIKKQAEILEAENTALKAAKLEAEKAENPTVPETAAATADEDAPAPKSRKK